MEHDSICLYKCIYKWLDMIRSSDTCSLSSPFCMENMAHKRVSNLVCLTLLDIILRIFASTKYIQKFRWAL